ncbi:MAG: ATP-binding cassette domain-containing protein, partial [Tissierellia bacterium]|nr:ATP-binding cassette domain-containing protein [Tissierellia bacterium]
MQEGYKQMVSASVREEILLQNSALTETEIKEFLKTVDLVDYIDRHPSRLSGGQVQRLAVLLAYISDKRIIVLDEPSSGLDLIHMRNVSELIRKMAKKGKFVLLISHDIELLASTADAFIYIENEKLSETQNLYSKCDFDLMTKHMKSKTERKISKKSQKLKPPNINPIVNILVFFAMANAIFLYPATKSSIYLMLILSFVLILNFNFYICIKAWIAYGILNLLKFYAPMYFKVVFEVFLIRGFMTNYALKNIIEKTETIYIIEALYRAKITDYLMIPLISILRLFPTLRHDSSICFMSLKTRNLTYKKSPRKIWNLIIVPLVFSLIRSAENLACGIETKGMKINQKRSCMSDIKFRIRDFAILIIFFANYIYIFIGG